jgi:hypothetical protein
MTIPAADCPYLRAVAELNAAPPQAPTHPPALLALLGRVLSQVVLAHRRQHPRSRTVGVRHGSESDPPVAGQRRSGSSPVTPLRRQDDARHHTSHTTR